MAEHDAQILVKISADTEGSLPDLKTQIEGLSKKLGDLKLGIEIDKSTLDQMQKLSDMDFSNIVKESKAIGKGFEESSSSIKKTQQDVEQFSKKSSEELAKVRKEAEKAMSVEFNDREALKSIDGIRDALKDTKSTITVDFAVKDGAEYARKVQTITETIAGKVKTTFEKANVGDAILWTPTQVQRVDSDLKTMQQAIAKAKEELKQLNKVAEEAGIRMESTNKAFSEGFKSTEQVESFRNLVKIQKEAIAENTKYLDQIRTLDRDLRKLSKERPQVARHEDYQILRAMVAQQENLASSGRKTTMSIKELRNSYKDLKVETTEVARSQMGLVDSFRVAMEKFPVWMAASTMFYASVRTAKEFYQIIVDIDTKMTDLRKVMADGTDFGAVFDVATGSAEKFGQTISQTMDSYIEFAKQGFKDVELEFMADAALVASNVGDVTAQRASEFLTAAVLQWEMDSNQAMGVIDSWNEIANNFATNLDHLATAGMKSASTARSMGLDFHQLNGIVGTLTATTKQSGAEIG